MRDADTNGGTGDQTDDEAGTIALRALVWTLAEPDRALRLLAVTGLDPRDLRHRTSDPAVLAACLAFLESHEPDLVACAATLGVSPAVLVAANRTLDRYEGEA